MNTRYVYPTFDLAYKALIHLLLVAEKSAPRGLPTLEILDHSWGLDPIGVLNPRLDFLSTQAFKRQDVYDTYAMAELAWYMSGELSAASAPSKFWLRLADEHGKINSNYGWMVLHDKRYDHGLKTAYESVLEQLRVDPNSRRAVMHYDMPRYHMLAEKDVPCTVAVQFLLRDNRLRAHVFQRSCDVIKGLGYDIPWHCNIICLLARDLGVRPGQLTHTIGSLHLYHKDVDLAEKIVTPRIYELIKPDGSTG